MSEDQGMTQNERIQQLLDRLGRTYLERQQYPQAYEKFAQLLELLPEAPGVLMNTAIAAVGMGRVDPEAHSLYERAVRCNQNSEALKIGLATLFMQKEITSTFAVHICEAATQLNPPNAQKLRLYLKKVYENTGDRQKVSRIEHEVVFHTNSAATIQSYIEGLWWDGKFDEAEKALQEAPKRNGATEELEDYTVLTAAYRHYFADTVIREREDIDRFAAALRSLQIRESLADLRKYLILRSRMPETLSRAGVAPQGVEEYEYILGDLPLDEMLSAYQKSEPQTGIPILQGRFDFETEMLAHLPEPDGMNSAGEQQTLNYKGFLFIDLVPFEKTQPPGKLVTLICMQLARLKRAILRTSGSAFISLAENPFQQVEAIVNLLRHLEDYNNAVARNEQIRLLAALCIEPKGLRANENDAILQALVKGSHLLKFTEQTLSEEAGAGLLTIIAPEKDLNRLSNRGFTLLTRTRAKILPGFETPFVEVIWRNPLSRVQQGQVYRINRFELRQCLVKHQNYATYLAMDVQLDRPVVVKILLPQVAVAALQNPALREELFEKMRTIGRINHPNIANLYDMGEHNKMIYFVREYVEGKPVLEAAIDPEKRENEILNIMQTLVRALSAAQREGIMHLNLKPGNIWISDAQQLTAVDFRFPGFGDDLTQTNVLYPAQWRNIAPELLAGELGDSRSDIYSLGLLAYELLAGQHPYDTVGSIQSPNDLRKVKIKPLRDAETPHHTAWDGFVARAIEAAPPARFQTFAEMELELRKIQMQLMQKVLDDTAR